MYKYCKLCGECLILDHYIECLLDNNKLYNYRCHLCSEYSLLSENIEKVWEQVVIGNVRLIVFPNEYIGNTIRRGLAFVQRRECGDFQNLYQFPLNNLTHELAVQWVKKLKTYLTFQ